MCHSRAYPTPVAFHCPQNNTACFTRETSAATSSMCLDAHSGEGLGGFIKPGPAFTPALPLGWDTSPAVPPPCLSFHCLAESKSPSRHLEGSFLGPLNWGRPFSYISELTSACASPPSNDLSCNYCLEPISFSRLQVPRKGAPYLF